MDKEASKHRLLRKKLQKGMIFMGALAEGTEKLQKQASKAATTKTLHENFAEKKSKRFFNMIILQYNDPIEQKRSTGFFKI